MSVNEKKVMDSLYGSLAVYCPETEKFQFVYCSERVICQLGYSREEFEALVGEDALKLVSEEDRKEVEELFLSAMREKTELNCYFHVRNKDGDPIWCKMNGWEDERGYSVLFSSMSPEIQLYQNIAGEIVDDIYVIDKKDFKLLYTNNKKSSFWQGENREGRKCYELLYGKKEPCSFCTLKSHVSDGTVHEMNYEEQGRFYATRFYEVLWDGIPAYVKYVRDITEEKKIEKEKRQLEQYFQTVLKYLPGGVAVVRHEVEGTLIPEFLSEGFAEMVNMPMENVWRMYQQNALFGVHPEDRDYVRDEINRCILQKKDRYELQYRLRKGEEGYIWVNAKFSLIQYSEREARVYVDYNDITEEKNLQKQLREQYQEQIVKHYQLSGPNVLILGHCNITRNKILEIVDYTDSGLLDRFGDCREEFFTGIGTLVVDEKEREAFYGKYLNAPSLEAFRRGEREVLMPCFVSLPGQERGRYVQFKVNLVETPDTEDITGVLTVTDITDKMIREQIFKRLSSITYDLVVDVDLYHNTFKIVSGGDEDFKDETGKFGDRVRSIQKKMVVEGDQKYFGDMLDASQVLKRLRREGTYTFSYSVVNANGDVMTKSMIVSAVDLRLGRICLVRTDVTEMLTAERLAKEELEKALSEAEKANSVKSEFLSSMSHDIRTPMNAIMGMTTLALANLENTEKVENYLQKISASSKHLLSLINDILDMSQIERSGIRLSQTTVRIGELVNQLTAIIMQQAQVAGVNFQIENSVREHTCFVGDSLRINQILINLLGNAFKFTPEGGSIWFRIHEISPHIPERIRYRFTVEDTGIGMSREFMEHLFEPFIRSDKVSKVEGTGLGLSITKGLVDLMGGTIQVESRLKEGTTFQVELEFDMAADQADHRMQDQPKVRAAGDLSGYHFLMVEDNEINSEILGELLQMRGASFEVKRDGLQAVEEFKKAPPGTYDAILMDVQMPVMNGYEATRAIRRLNHPDAETIVILAMTANAFAEDVQASSEAGMNGHIAKPVDMTMLCRTLSKLLDPEAKHLHTDVPEPK